MHTMWAVHSTPEHECTSERAVSNETNYMPTLQQRCTNTAATGCVFLQMCYSVEVSTADYNKINVCFTLIDTL